MAQATRVLTSEWTKIRSVRSTLWTLAAALVVTVAMGMLISLLFQHTFDDLPRAEQLTFDPTFISFAGTSLGQLAMIAFGILVVSNEYSTGMIRASLSAVPQRGTLMFAKVAIATGLALVVAMVTSFLAFFLGQLMLGEYGTSISEPGVLRAVFGAGLYMTLMSVFAMGITWILRSPMLAFGILIPFFFMISTILGAVEVTEKIGHYLPDQAGSMVMNVLHPDEGRPYGPWGGMLIMAIWVIVALVAGYFTLRKRDA